jgi:hypothetical protein
MSKDAERDRALDRLSAHGWYVHEVSRKGYYKMRCGCGEHTGMLHKTPSNPNHYREKTAFLISKCSSI